MAHPATLRYKRALNHLQDTAASHIGAAFANLPSYDQATSNLFIAVTVPAVAAAQNHAAALTSAYLADFLPGVLGRTVETPGVDEADVTGAATRNGVEPGDVYRRSFVEVWKAAVAGVAIEVAVNAARSRIEQAVSTDVALSARETSRAVLSAEGVTRYQRVSSGGCELCDDADGAVYSTDDVMPIHPGCQCASEPLEADPRPSPETDDVIEVEEHGELGPVLWAAGDKFTPDPGE